MAVDPPATDALAGHPAVTSPLPTAEAAGGIPNTSAEAVASPQVSAAAAAVSPSASEAMSGFWCFCWFPAHTRSQSMDVSTMSPDAAVTGSAVATPINGGSAMETTESTPTRDLSELKERVVAQHKRAVNQLEVSVLIIA